MKAQVIEIETAERIFIELFPETLEEASILLRLAARRRKIAPLLRTSFCEDILTIITFEMNQSPNRPDTEIS